jgi:hypothetical protein
VNFDSSMRHGFFQRLARSADTHGCALQLIGLHGLDAVARKREPL